MCLSKVTKHKPCKVGYKVMNDNRSGYCTPCCGNCKAIPVGEWVDEVDYRSSTCPIVISSTYGDSYPIGFHVFHSKYGAELFGGKLAGNVIMRTKVEAPICTGHQQLIVEENYARYANVHVTVAKRIKLLKEVQ